MVFGMAAREPWTELARTMRRVNVPSAIVDREGVVTWLNDAATALFGDLRGQSFLDVVAPEDAARVRSQLEQKLSGEVAATDYEIDVLTRTGERRRAEIGSVVIEGGDRCHAIFGVGLPLDRRPSPRPDPRLTRRQNEVLMLLGEGLSTDQIASMLHLSRETVRNHIRHVLRALGAHSRLEAVAMAHRQGLLG
jgi:PAS domain S-box-containing protein